MKSPTDMKIFVYLFTHLQNIWGFLIWARLWAGCSEHWETKKVARSSCAWIKDWRNDRDWRWTQLLFESWSLRPWASVVWGCNGVSFQGRAWYGAGTWEHSAEHPGFRAGDLEGCDPGLTHRPKLQEAAHDKQTCLSFLACVLPLTLYALAGIPTC